MAEKNISAELEQLQLEEAREAAEQRRNKRQARKQRLAVIERTLKRDKAQRELIQASCQHRKGGKGTAQMYMGNDANYAVITHTISSGGKIVVCQRCGKLWEAPEPLSKKATAEEKLKYREQMAEFRRAVNLPTDNEPSGSVLFTFTSAEEEMTA